jgi:hypothetical protein
MRRGLPILFVALATLWLPGSVSTGSQKELTRDAIRKLYGVPVSEIYRTSEKLVVTASFAPSGNLCRARIQSDAGEIRDKELKAALDTLVPANVRGKYKMGTFLDYTCLKLVKSPESKSGFQTVPDTCAECGGVSEDYERLTITKYGNSDAYSSVNINFHKPECSSSGE